MHGCLGFTHSDTSAYSFTEGAPIEKVFGEWLGSKPWVSHENPMFACELTNTRGMNSDPTNFQGLGLQGRHVFCEGTNWTPYAREPVLAIDSFAKTLQKESDVVL